MDAPKEAPKNYYTLKEIAEDLAGCDVAELYSRAQMTDEGKRLPPGLSHGPYIRAIMRDACQNRVLRTLEHEASDLTGLRPVGQARNEWAEQSSWAAVLAWEERHPDWVKALP